MSDDEKLSSFKRLFVRANLNDLFWWKRSCTSDVPMYMVTSKEMDMTIDQKKNELAHYAISRDSTHLNVFIEIPRSWNSG